jgi:uncharacterized protein YbbK (DUF523 family)
MAGWGCGVDGTDYGMGVAIGDLLRIPLLRAVPFCPEDVGIGTPRRMPDIHGGDGFDVLDGRARVLDDRGGDVTSAMIFGAKAMVEKAETERVLFAILTDMSGACGTQVISEGCRFDAPRRYQRGAGVAAAALSRAGVPVVSQRDYRTLALIRERVKSPLATEPNATDHHESEWVRANLPRARPWPPRRDD